MIAAFVALLALTVLFIFFLPWVGILTGIVAAIPLVLIVLGVGAASRRTGPLAPDAQRSRTIVTGGCPQGSAA